MNIYFDREKLNELLVDFHVLTKIKIVIFDNEFKEIMAYPQASCEFCSIIKSYQHTKLLCDKSDKNACEICRDTGRVYVYQCYFGLTEAVAPIKMNDIVIGYIMFGQFVNQENIAKAKEEMLEKCRPFNLDTDKLVTAFDKLMYKTPEEIRAASKILESCASYLLISKLMSVDEGALIYKISHYIDNNIKEKLSVETICDHFLISRSKLYELSNKYFGMGIAKYIRKKRIELAKKLLADGNSMVKEVAYNVGFNDYNYFSKVFKRETGATPKEIKKRL